MQQNNYKVATTMYETLGYGPGQGCVTEKMVQHPSSFHTAWRTLAPRAYQEKPLTGLCSRVGSTRKGFSEDII